MDCNYPIKCQYFNGKCVLSLEELFNMVVHPCEAHQENIDKLAAHELSRAVKHSDYDGMRAIANSSFWNH